MISLLDLTQWKSQKKTVSSGNRFLPRIKIHRASRTSTKNPSWSPESSLVLYTSEIFQPGVRASHVFLNCPLSDVIHAMDFLQRTQMMWLSLLKPSWGRSTLLLWWSFCLLPSFLPDDLCWYAGHCLCWHQSVTLPINKSLAPNIDSGPWDPE